VVVPCPSSALWLLSPADKNAGESEIRKRVNTNEMKGRVSNPTKSTCLEDPQRGTPVARNASVNTLLIETPWSRNSCHNASSAWALSKWVGGAPARHSSYSGYATATLGASGPAHDVEASMSCAGRCDITQPSSRITSTSDARSRADTGWLPHCPPGERRRQRHPPPPHGPPQAGSPDELARALGKESGEPVPATSSSSSLPLPLVAAPWPQPRRATAHPSPPCSPLSVPPSTNAASSSQALWT
jgi:hypothetical protein